MLIQIDKVYAPSTKSEQFKKIQTLFFAQNFLN